MKKLTLALIPMVFCFAAGAQATTILRIAELFGDNEFPPNASPGSGRAVVVYDSDTHTLSIEAEFSGLLGNTTAAHIHCCTAVPFDISLTAGVATQVPSFSGFPLGVTSGTYSQVFDLTNAASFNPSFITASGSLELAEARLAQGIAVGTAYFNIHTSVFGGGEIRGFLRVPEPATLGLLGIGLAALAARRKRR
ncbi:MAG TPA: CHRD domain-containing protein [Vicinamibacteria bacterium]|nr:CHRD domain-containing protein [Vicinamibacteria bacterium]